MQSVKSDFYRGDRGWNNVEKNMEEIFDTDWFYRRGEDPSELNLWYAFIDDFLVWLENQGEDMHSYVGKKIDIGWYFKEYMEDKPCPEIKELYKKVGEWLEAESDYALSQEYLDGLYAAESGAAELDFYIQDIDENAEKQMKSGDSHGFANAQDLADAAKEAAERGCVETCDVYDGGGMGWHSFDEDADYFETGCLYLGNGEEESQLESPVPFSEEYDYGDVYRSACVNGDCVYVVSTLLYVYGIKWSEVERIGDEMGLRGGER